MKNLLAKQEIWGKQYLSIIDRFVGCKSVLTAQPPSPVVYSSDRSKVVVPVLVLLFVALWFTLRGNILKSCLVLFCSCVFQSF